MASSMTLIRLPCLLVSPVSSIMSVCLHMGRLPHPANAPHPWRNVVLSTSRKQASTSRYHRIRTSVGNANKRSVNLSLPPPSPFSHGADFIQAAVFGPSNYSAARSSSSNQKQRSTQFSSTSFFMTWRRRRSGTKQTSFHIIGRGVFGINAISTMHFLSTLGRNTLHKISLVAFYRLYHVEFSRLLH
jgi:hypothetical protein